MNIRLITTSAAESAQYSAWVRAHPHGTLWQSPERKRYLEACDREVRIYLAVSDERVAGSNEIEATALVVIDRTSGGFSTWEIPRGPLWRSDERSAVGDELVGALIERIVTDAKRERCIALYLSPPIALTAQRSPVRTAKWPGGQLRASLRHVHCEATRMIDLTLSEDALLAQMHPKGRYNIGVAKRSGVSVSIGTAQDLPAFMGLLKETAKRDGFTVSSESHYTHFLSSLEGSFLLTAKHADKPVGGLLGVMWNAAGIYYYGASSFPDRALMAPYLLQWEAMRLCKAAGCTRYDLLGIERVTASGEHAAGPWAGITEFKRKFGGTVVTYPPEQMLVLRPWAYRALQLKRALLG